MSAAPRVRWHQAFCWRGRASFFSGASQGSRSLLALMALLPEFVVDRSYAWLAGEGPRYAHDAVANMTGANRVLLGANWPLLLLVAGQHASRRPWRCGPSREN